MKIGTKSVLFGAHCFVIHPWFVALAWWKLFGFPFDPRLWLAFFVHDIGYLGRPNMDGPEGEAHVFLGAQIMATFDAERFNHWFGWKHRWFAQLVDRICGRGAPDWYTAEHPSGRTSWYRFSFYHSRFMARRYSHNHSMLCLADKLSVTLEPEWLYLPRVVATGEIREYMAHRLTRSKYAGEPISAKEREHLERDDRRSWFRGMSSYTRRWVEQHRDGRPDFWTPDRK